MLVITVKGEEFYDESLEEFVYPESFDLHLEHSLVTLSKWESKFKKAYLGLGEKTSEEALGYVEAMVLDTNLPPDFMLRLSQEDINRIGDYINDSMTATWFSDNPTARSRETVTAEVVYDWLFQAGLPIEVEHWHLNKLFTQIRVRSAKTNKPKKQSRSEMMAQRRALNEKRLAEGNTRG